MKRILLMLLSLSFAFTSNAQLSEDFESGTFPPVGWVSFIGANGFGATENWKAQEFPTGNQGAVCIWEVIPGGASQRSEDWLVTPQFTVDAASAILSFDNVDSSSTDYLSTYTVRVSTASQNTHADFTIVDTQDETQIFHSQTTLAGMTHTVDLSAYIGQDIYVAFVMEQNDGDLWRLDNINMTSAITCPAPTAVVFSNQTISSVQIDWTVGNSETSWNVEYGPIGFTQGMGTTVNVMTNPTTTISSGLAEATGYDVYVQADCGGTDGVSVFTDVLPFYTKAAPYNVADGIDSPSNNVENGASCSADGTNARFIAHDIIVAANTNLTLTKIVPHVLMMPGVTAANVDVIIYADVLGLPGTVVSTQNAIVPTSSKTSGTNFGFVVNELELDITSVVLAGDTTPKTYWIGISVHKSDAGATTTNCFWENKTTGLVGSGQAYNDGLVGYVADSALEGVYSFIATSSVLGVKDDVLSSSISIYPTTVANNFTIKNESTIALTSVSLFDINGRVVLTQELENLIGEKSINISNLSTGMYFVELSSADAKTTKKIIKK